MLSQLQMLTKEKAHKQIHVFRVVKQKEAGRNVDCVLLAFALSENGVGLVLVGDSTDRHRL